MKKRYIVFLILLFSLCLYNPTAPIEAKKDHLLLIESSTISDSQTILDGRQWPIVYDEGLMRSGNHDYTYGIPTYLDSSGNWQHIDSWSPKFENFSYVNDSIYYHVYSADGGRFQSKFFNNSNQIITKWFEFSQQPNRIGLYNWATDTWIHKQDPQQANEIIWTGNTLNYTGVYSNTDFVFTYNGTHLKEIIYAKSTTWWPKPVGWNWEDTYLLFWTKIFDFNRIKIHDDDGEITGNKTINGLLKLKDSATGQAIRAYMPLGQCYANFTGGRDSTEVKTRIRKINGIWYLISGINYRFIYNGSRTTALEIDPSWTIGSEGEQWSENVDFYQTRENEITGYAELAPTYTWGTITSHVREAQQSWVRIQYDGNLNNKNVDIYFISSRDNGLTDPFDMNLVKTSAQPKTDYILPTASKERFGYWHFVLSTDNPNFTPEIYNVTIFNDPSGYDDFTYYKNITIDSAKVSGTGSHTNFSILFDIFDSDLKDNCQADGDDIAFANSTHWLDHEIEIYNSTYNATHAWLVSWIRIPSLSTSVDTEIVMYYSNATMGAQQNPTGVWDSNYYGVWHLSEESGDAQDSTSYSTNGTVSGGTTQGESGAIGNSYLFDRDLVGTVSMGDPGDGHLDIIDGVDFTLQYWVNLDYFYFYPAFIVAKRAGLASSSAGYAGLATNDNFGFPEYSLSSNGPVYDCESQTTTMDQGWTLIHHVFDDDTEANCEVYINGTEETFSTSGNHAGLGSMANSANFRLNGRSTATTDYSMDGLLDEVRLLKVLRSADWIATEFENQYNATGFYSVGSEQEITPAITTPTTTPPTIPQPPTEGINIFYEIFYSLQPWGYLGPMGLVIIGYFVSKKERNLGILWFVMECLIMAHYLSFVNVEPNYWWHFLILFLGGLSTCVFPLWDRKR